MVDHSGDKDDGLSILRPTSNQAGWGWSELSTRWVAWLRDQWAGVAVGFQRAKTMVAAAVEPSDSSVPEAKAPTDVTTGAARRPATSSEPLFPQLSMTTLALIASIVWVLAICAYGIGYMARLDEADPSRTLPTLDVMFMVFAIVGPVAMLWIVVALLRRTETLSEHIAAQGESALALAATVANLNDSIDGLSAATQGRLIDACDRIEQHADTATAAFERNLEETGARLNRVMLESVVLIDERISGRVDAFEAALERQRASLDQHLRDDTGRLTDALELQSSAMEKRLTENTARLNAAIEAELGALAEVKTHLLGHVRTGLADSRAELNDGIASTLAHQKSGLEETNRKLNNALDAFSETLNNVKAEHTRLLDIGVGQPVLALSTEIANTRKELAAHPPASAEELAGLLGKSSQQILRQDRQRIEDVVLRVEALEAKAGVMLDKIDRTSRLNPLMDPPKTASTSLAEEMEIRDAELPFADLPRAMSRAPMNWGAALKAMDGEARRQQVAPAVKAAAQDLDLGAVLRQTEEVGAALSVDRVHLEDLTVEHASSELWYKYAMGVRGEDVAALGEVPDEITLALVRARLRGDMEFRALAIRFAASYGRLLRRAATELGSDPKLVEMAETKAGRAFVLLGGLVGAFDPVAGPIDEPSDLAS